MKIKQKFLLAVQLLAPGDTFIFQIAERAREEDLPSAPGAAALELVANLVRLSSRTGCPRRAVRYGLRRKAIHRAVR
jgi:hypothetical protein